MSDSDYFKHISAYTGISLVVFELAHKTAPEATKSVTSTLAIILRCIAQGIAVADLETTFKAYDHAKTVGYIPSDT